MKPLALALAALGCAAGLAFGQAGFRSIEIHPDHTVTFRLKDPNAKSVVLSLEGADGMPMTKDAEGVWSSTTGPLAPDLYGYSFVADGETVMDPRNPLVKPNLIWASNMFLLPGDQPELWEVQDVPHGEVHHHFYKSALLGDQRDYFVYTPPGYQTNARTRYPVLYLLHGFSDMAGGWTAVGQANVILDNLIAQGKAKPMVIVMPLGYGIPNFGEADRTGLRNTSVRQNMDQYRSVLLTEVIPQVERSYRVSSDKKNRAIAGLSMGGAETLYTGLNNLDKFAYVASFSAGGLGRDLNSAFPGFDGARANRELKLMWVSCGVDDGLITPNRQIVKWLTDHGTHVQAVETPGRHAWMVWRRNLAAVAAQLFR